MDPSSTSGTTAPLRGASAFRAAAASAAAAAAANLAHLPPCLFCLPGPSAQLIPALPLEFIAGDDAGLSEGQDTEADVTRAIVADEERQAAAHAAAGAAARAGADESADEQPEASTSYSIDHLEQAKLLLSGGVAGAFSKSCTAPLARLTILYQVRGCGGGQAGRQSSRALP